MASHGVRGACKFALFKVGKPAYTARFIRAYTLGGGPNCKENSHGW